MSPDQARVFVVEPDLREKANLISFVEHTGGEVVGSVETRKDADEVIGSPKFPDNAGNPNVVLIASHLVSPLVPDGHEVFKSGYKKGVLRPADSKAGLGVLAIASSKKIDTDVELATGANFSLLKVGEDKNRWADMLDGHTATPEVARPGTISRKKWMGNSLKEIIDSALKDVGAVDVHSLSISEQVLEGDEPVHRQLESRIVGSTIPVIFLPDIMDRLGTDSPDDESRLYSHSASAAVLTDSDLVFLKYTWERFVGRTKVFDPHFLYFGSSDIIPLRTVETVPDSYWQEIDLDPHSL